ncbi:hypothetical protein AXK11_04045 [Cephaloticoccus primus]|uniref:Type-4 uracil-DNA glycosylase n=1 Tax=Cephaloticoccus primus TaxID=1548207 RepID=A0A139SPT2_9BACT|nr:uracil-DNA glycosylase [Cephaloticoccus primus]KXU36532.1 hypothetical protein AXK11_04045 [Cephaloticoccus primus]
MRASLTALTEELRRLKASGLREISVAPESLERLRAAVRKRRASAQPVVSEGQSAANRSVGELRGVARPEPRPTRESAPLAHMESRPAAVGAAPAAPASPRPSAARPQLAAALSPLEPAPALSSPPVKEPPPPLPTPSITRSATFTIPTAGTKAERLAALREIVLSDEVCRAQLRPGKRVVFGVGNPEAKIVFVGEAPGADEEEQGEPFVGRAGQLLTKMIQAMGLAREDVYIANIMNWRPQMPTLRADGEQVGNRPPTPEEMAYCLPYLQAQLSILTPQVIVALGATAARGLLGHDAFKTLGELRGKWREFAGCPLMVTYHPSYILRNQSNRSKRTIWEDFLKVMERAALPISEKQRGYFLG